MEGTHYAVVATGQMVLTPSLSPTFDDDDDSDHDNNKTTIMMITDNGLQLKIILRNFHQISALFPWCQKCLQICSLQRITLDFAKHDVSSPILQLLVVILCAIVPTRRERLNIYQDSVNKQRFMTPHIWNLS